MNIKEKIEFVRQQPDHVRMRYVWICVTASMLVVFAIWIFSITMTFKKNVPPEKSIDTTELQQQLQDIKEQTSSLKDYASHPLTLDEEGVSSGSSSAPSDNASKSSETNTPPILPGNETDAGKEEGVDSQEKFDNSQPPANNNASEIPEKRMPPDLPNAEAGDRP